jgi:hypothetical protein
VANAQLVNGRFVTSFYTFQRFDTVGTSATYLRAYQSVQLTAAQGDFSLQTFLQGAVNGTSDFGDNGRVRVYNLFLRWANIGRAVDLNLGRQAVYAGVGNGTIDGLLARARLWEDKITLTGYAGSSVSASATGINKDFYGNFHGGGQLLVYPLTGTRVGVSYMNRREKPDPYWTIREQAPAGDPDALAAVPYYIANGADAEEFGSADVSYAYGNILSAYGRFDYDFNFKRASRYQGSARVNVTDAWTLTGDYIYRQPRVAFNSIFSAFTMSSVNEVEGGVEYGFAPLMRAFAKLGVVTYAGSVTGEKDNSTRWTVGLNTGYGSASYSGGTGYAGELQSFTVQAVYPVCDRMLIPSLGVTYASYRISTDAPKDDALALLLGATVRPMKTFSFDVQGQWLKNRLYNSDLRAQVRLMYWFAERLSLFSEETQP